MAHSMNYYKARYQSQIGTIIIVASEDGLSRLLFDDEPDLKENPQHVILHQTLEQLEQYFRGKRKIFNLPLSVSGSDFQKKVWREVAQIKFGQTASYLEIARRVGNEKAVRAVGLANGKNPLPLLIPCHRIIGTNGNLIGYGGGLWRKEWLLRHEGAILV